MKAELILKKITYNWFPKCLCIVSAISLYLFAKTSRLETKTFSVPLVVKEDGGLARANLLPTHVSVTIKSEPDNISSLTTSDIQAVLDLTFYSKAGTYNVPVSTSLATGVSLASPVELTVYPENISISLEERVRKAVPVDVPVYGNPLHGYEVRDVKFSPQHVIISGPKSLVDNINEMTTFEVSLSEKKDDFTDVKKIRPVNRHVEVVTTDNIDVNVSFQTSLVTKTFNDCQVYLGHLDPRFEVENVPDISFTVSGAQLVLEKFYPTEYTIQTDCSMITAAGEYELPVVIAVQDAFKIESQSLQTVKIIVKEKSVNIAPVSANDGKN